MTITAWRITKRKYAHQAFSGEGAKRFGGRWNPRGYAVVYTAETLSLTILELIVHLETYDDIEAYVSIPVQFEPMQVMEVPVQDLPSNWHSLPLSIESQNLGKRWLDKMESLVLKVPSSVVRPERNYLINPLHPEFEDLSIGSPQLINIDPRIKEKLN